MCRTVENILMTNPYLAEFFLLMTLKCVNTPPVIAVFLIDLFPIDQHIKLLTARLNLV